ncbi:GAF domain-containing protein [Opitutus terrae]|uniref:histidine kinase n=1 Tax=Opitutus terrae (strain DSM 11246 / JCM 15787 / PB90-1) TaxID=452637 RepID=B1ZYQ1_OPITP|nr:GAF domain-containing protein [Opitutus terrae]ACB75287.1 GAF sensor signal transduction histidine kinase [Opitutus terrae PB90-1]
MSTPADPRALSALYRLTSLARQAEDPHSVLRDALEVLVSTFQADAGSIALFNPSTGLLEDEVQHGLPPSADPSGLKLGHGITGWCVLNARSLLVPDVSTEPRYIAERSATRCEMAVPMRDGERVIGVANLESDRRGGFSAEDLALLEQLTAETTHLVLLLWRTRHLQAKARQFETLLSSGQSLVAKLEKQELFATLTRDTREMMQGRSCALFHQPADAALVRCVAQDHADATTPGIPAGDLPIKSSLVAAAFHTKRQVEFSDVQSPGFGGLADLPDDPTLHSALYTPLLHEGEVFGVLAVFLDRVHRFDDDEKRACASLASLGAVALQNARLYARVFESEEKLRKSEQLTTLGLLAAEIAHEIRNPLTVIKLLHGGLGLDFPPDDPRRTDVRVINEKLDQLESIVSRVLNFAKAPAALHSRWSVADMISDTLVLVRPKLAQAHIHLSFQAPAQPLVVDAHKGQLQQVLLNLIFNATEAMTATSVPSTPEPPPARRELSIAVGQELRGSVSMVTIDVTDSGAGIAPELAPRIFDSFLSGRTGGTGLGLAIAKRILESHHGEITLRATGPSGTTMRVTLPLAKS